MSPMLSGVFIKGDNGWVVLAHKTISVPLRAGSDSDLILEQGHRPICSQVSLSHVSCHPGPALPKRNAKPGLGFMRL